MKTELLFVVDQLEAGGLERQLSYLISQLSKDPEFRVSCFVWNYSENAYYFRFFKEHISGDLLGANSADSFRARQKLLRKQVISTTPKFVVSYSNFTNFQAFLASLFIPSKAFGAMRSSAAYMLDSISVKKVLSLLFPLSIISNSQVAIGELREKWWLRHIDYRFFPNFIDLKSFTQKQTTGRDEYNSISVGTLLPEKRLARLFDLIAEVKKEKPDIKHIHLGDGPLMEEYQKKVVELNLQENLVFHGKTKAVGDFLANSQIFVHFSDFEGTPNVVLEGMALGMPIISTNCGDVERYVFEGKNGFIIKKDKDYSHEKCHRDYMRLLEDSELRSNMGQASYNEIKKYRIENMARHFKEVVSLR